MKKTTPFKSPADFEKDLTDFSNRHKITLAEHSKRISDYFEMTCYNLVVRYYEKLGYELTVQNLKGGSFKYKCSPTGFLQNFSYFKASKIDEQGNDETIYIFHNATAQSAFDEKVFTTPDIVVSKTETPSESTDYYPSSKMKLTFIGKDDLITFCEAKHFSPFPELMINFVGTVHELKPECIDNEIEHHESVHLAPTLMMSGTFGKPTGKIMESLEHRYYVNYFDNLFNVPAKSFFTKKQMAEVATLARKSKRGINFDSLLEDRE